MVRYADDTFLGFEYREKVPGAAERWSRVFGQGCKWISAGAI